jgi:hypothetical protein
MFDLEQSILEWRKQMLAAGIKTPVPLEELESHLREDIAQQMKSGTNPNKLFRIPFSELVMLTHLRASSRKCAELGSI